MLFANPSCKSISMGLRAVTLGKAMDIYFYGPTGSILVTLDANYSKSL